ncbi:MAG: hypothetical protein KDC38_09845, partial [Planctomycetes bacterium]|nr:hypothetical protein [Planctomycetota bacterium]
MKRQSRTEGFTIVEASIAVAIGALLTGVVLSIGVETMKFSSYADSDFAVQYEANRAFDRVSEVLRKVGWNNSAGATYPHVLSAGAEIQFRMLQDLDGNGYTFDGSTG